MNKPIAIITGASTGIGRSLAIKLSDNYLENISITVFTKDFELIKNIESEKANITNFVWVMENAIVYQDNLPKKNH